MLLFLLLAGYNYLLKTVNSLEKQISKILNQVKRAVGCFRKVTRLFMVGFGHIGKRAAKSQDGE